MSGLVAAPVAASALPDRHDAFVEMAGALDPVNASMVLTILDAFEAAHPGSMTVKSGDTAPETPGFVAVSPPDSIQAAIDAAPAGSTISLNPGTYYEHDITISKNIRIQANPSAGGSRSNTIIDAENLGRIFTITGPYTVTIDNLAMWNGAAPQEEGGTIGGAILTADDSALTITSSSFSGCSASDDVETAIAAGGAIFSSGMLTVTSTSFEDCSVSGYGAEGGAIYSERYEDTTIVSSSFTQCRANGYILGIAGAVDGADSITSSTFTDCSASGMYISGGGAVVYADSIASSTFTGCTANALFESIGGAIVYVSSLSSSTFEHCSVSAESIGLGGAVAESNSVTSSAFTECSVAASGHGPVMPASPVVGDSGPIGSGGGAIFGARTITSSTFIRCSASGSSPGPQTPATGSPTVSSVSGSAGTGGAVYMGYGMFGGPVGSSEAVGTPLPVSSVTSSTFVDCSADVGGAIFADEPFTVHFSRIYDNTATLDGPAIYAMETADATNNWWGNNSDPSPQVSGPVTTSPWLVLNLTAPPQTLTSDQTSLIHATLTRTSDGADTAGGGIFVPNKILSSFAVVSGPGSVSPHTAGTAGGRAAATYTPLVSGTANLSATVDDQTVYLILPVARIPIIPTLDTSGNDDDGPRVPQASATQADSLPLMTVTVNIGGNTGAGKATVTGTTLSGLIVTGTLQPGLSSNFTAPPGTVYQYISLVPARYDRITGAVINFTVPQAWLDAHTIAPGSIVLYHQTAGGWEALPTTQLFTRDGTVYFSAQSTGFSLFAITGAPAVLTPPGTVATPAAAGTGAPDQLPVKAAVTTAPVTTQTTAPPAATPKPSAPSPLLNIVLVIAAIGILGAGGFLVRRWWIHRQNPALFEEF